MSQSRFLALAAPPDHGLALDYTMLDSDTNNFTLQGDTTYFVSNDVNLAGVTTIQGGAVVKFSFDGELDLDGSSPVVCQTSAYHPAIFTSMNNNSVGEKIAGSSGQPSYTDVNLALYVEDAGGNTTTLHDLRFSHMETALAYFDPLEVWNCQFVDAETAVEGGASALGLYNVLISRPRDRSFNVDGAVVLNGNNLIAENVTEYGGTNYNSTINSRGGFVDTGGGDGTIALTNCLIVNNPILWDYSAPLLTNATYCVDSSPTPIFQTAGAGGYYLATNTYRGLGATNINPTLLAELRTKTTWPPTVYSNQSITTNIILAPRVPRDTNAMLDIGYHYSPLDDLVGGFCVSNADVTIKPGTVIGAFGLDTFNSGNPYGLDVEGGGQFNCRGLATEPIRIVGYSTVQEGPPGTNWALPAAAPLLLADFVQNSPTGALFDFRFTGFSSLAQDDVLWAFQNVSTVYFRDCDFYGGYNESQSVNVTNCLFDRTITGFFPLSGEFSSFYNNLVYGGQFFLEAMSDGGATNLAVQNNLFDVPDVSLTYPVTFDISRFQTADCGYNAWFIPPADFTNVSFPHDMLLTNELAYERGPLGEFYQPTNSPLIYEGSTNAGALGLYHYTVTTNLVAGQEVPDGTNRVSIGYHYVAVDANGNPLDSNGDGVPDYLEDANGNGVVDPGETNWALAILVRPENQAVMQGSNAAFSVTAEGIPPLSYQCGIGKARRSRTPAGFPAPKAPL